MRTTRAPSGDALREALAVPGALFFGGGGKPSQVHDIPVASGDVAGEVPGTARTTDIGDEGAPRLEHCSQ
jgi:hypothetical protein